MSTLITLPITAAIIWIVKWGGDYFFVYAWLFSLIVSLVCIPVVFVITLNTGLCVTYFLTLLNVAGINREILIRFRADYDTIGKYHFYDFMPSKTLHAGCCNTHCWRFFIASEQCKLKCFFDIFGISLKIILQISPFQISIGT